VKNNVVLITGASSGFGEAAVHRFMRQGARVIALARRENRLQNLSEQYGDRLHVMACDIRNREDIHQGLAALPHAFAEIDVLVNNAGLALGLEPAHKAHEEEWLRMVDTNITGLLLITRAILPRMVDANRGHIINIGSVAGEFPYPGGNVYGATKAFVHQFSQNLRADLLGTAVRVTVIEPGLSGGTEFSQVRFRGDENKAQSVYQDKKSLTADDVAEAIAWCSEQPPHVNINVISMMPVCQAFSALSVSRDAKANPI
jgi:3-hydroxy acid dehydrogenase/malonic semialdehyde reductase